MHQPGASRRRLLAAILLLPMGAAALADRVGYSSIFDCKAESDVLIVEHHHDWSSATHDARWQMISTDKDVFNSRNTYSYLQVVDRKDGSQRFKVPVPALTYLWISPDSRFIVGVSDVKLWNPVQLVLLNDRGAVLLAKNIEAASFPGVSETVTNYVYWYKEPVPKISIASIRGTYTLSVEGNTGGTRTFEFRDLPQ